MPMKLDITYDEALAIVMRYDATRVRINGVVEPENPLEEVFTLQYAGTFAVGRIKKLIASLKPSIRDKLTSMQDITPEVISLNSMVDISMARVHSIPIEVCFTQPALMMETEDHSCFIGDGHHRLRKLIMMGGTKFLAVIAPWPIVKQYMVVREMRDRKTGKWEPLDPQVELAMSVGQFHHHNRPVGKEFT